MSDWNAASGDNLEPVLTGELRVAGATFGKGVKLSVVQAWIDRLVQESRRKESIMRKGWLPPVRSKLVHLTSEGLRSRNRKKFPIKTIGKVLSENASAELTKVQWETKRRPEVVPTRFLVTVKDEH